MTQVIGIGSAGEVTVDEAKFTPEVNAYIFNYGLKQMLNDVHASITAKVEADETKRNGQKMALVEKKLASLYAGEVAQARVGSTGNAVEREMRAMAEAELKGKLKAINKKVGDFDKKVWADIVSKQVVKAEAVYRVAAEAKLAIKPETVETADDIMAMLTGE